jgi:protocatechuate 3,4-dioxygenase, beta subunit
MWRSSHLLCSTLLAFGTAVWAAEPVIGGPCEGCELVFDGLPEQLEWQARIAPAGEPGEPLIIEGVVRSSDGAPAAGVIVYAYHTDAGGIYPRGSVRHGRLRGWARTDAGGRYRFETIRPGGYPGNSEPQHVHMHVLEPGKGTYYIDDLLFLDDPRLTPARRSRQPERGGSGVSSPEKDSAGRWLVRRDIVLGMNVPGA